jgi:hypothetical protein
LVKILSSFDKLGASGLIITAILSPCCFPLFAFAATATGLGSFELFGGWTMWVFQAMVIITVAGFIGSYKKHHCAYPLLFAVPGALLVFLAIHFIESDNWMNYTYSGMALIFVATGVNFHRNKLHSDNSKNEMKHKSIITCPHCGHKKEETMPTDACAFFYECEKCKTVIKPKAGDCCVYCSYGTEKCPPMQGGKGCC